MRISATVIEGYGAASGKKGDNRYPKGTIAMQIPFFKALGLDLTPYYPGTLNVDITPFTFDIGQPKYYFEKVTWTEHIPPENFYFFDIVLMKNGTSHCGLVYLPDPKTKTEHQQTQSTLELILPKIEGLNYDSEVELEIDPNQIRLLN